MTDAMNPQWRTDEILGALRLTRVEVLGRMPAAPSLSPLRAEPVSRLGASRFDRLSRGDGEVPWKVVMPMATRAAQVRRRDVDAWWADQPFDLGIKGWQGNCDLCFLKGERLLKRIIRDEPERAVWWDRMEQTIGKGTFEKSRSYAGLVRAVASSPLLPLEEGDDEEFDAECGLWCSGEAA